MKKENPALSVAFGLLKCAGYFLLYLLAQSAVIFFAQLVFMVKFPGMDATAITELVNSYLVELTVLANAVAIALFALLSTSRGSSLFEAAHYNRFPRQYILSLLVLGVACMYAVAIIFSLIPFPEKWLELLTNTNAPIANSKPVMQFLLAVIFAPLLEETLFRGLMIGTLKKSMHPWIAIVISAILFGFAHGSPFDMETGNPIGFLYSALLGILMGWLFVKFNSILPTILFHMAYNFAVSYASEKVSFLVAFACIPVIIFEIYVLNKHKRGE